METHEQQNARHRQVVADYYETDDERVLGPLLAELRTLAVGYARRELRLYDGERAQDAAQDGLLEVLLLLRARRFDLDRPGSLSGLVCLRCRSRYLNSLARHSARTARPGADDDPYLLLGPAVATQPDELPVGAEHAAEASRTVVAATGAVLGLDPNARAAVVLHYYQGLPVPEAAARLGVDEQQYRTRLNRGLAALRTWGESQPHPSGEVYASLPYLHTGDLFREPLRLAG